MTMRKRELLTPDEVADYLKVPVTTIWRWCRENTIPAVKIGKYWRIPASDLDDFIDHGSNRWLEEREMTSV